MIQKKKEKWAFLKLKTGFKGGLTFRAREISISNLEKRRNLYANNSFVYFSYLVIYDSLLDISLINVNVILQDNYFVSLLYSFVLCPLFSFSVRALFGLINIIFFGQFLV